MKLDSIYPKPKQVSACGEELLRWLARDKAGEITISGAEWVTGKNATMKIYYNELTTSPNVDARTGNKAG